MQEQKIYGKNTVFEWLETDRSIERVWILQGIKKAWISKLQQELQKRDITLNFVNKQILNQLVGHANHQGVVAGVKFDKLYYHLDEIDHIIQTKNEPGFIGILDGIQDPQNLGAIIRSADATGLHALIIAKHGAVGLTPAVLKASAGAMIHVPVVQVTNIAKTIDLLKARGYWFLAADHDAEQAFYTVDLPAPIGLVIGSEGFGIRRLVKKKCDFLVSIPMYGHVNSLNASVAAGILFYHVRQQRITCES
jgi:23S rRNA (guanosine2251-2'-O)-methyltransferase